jgi:dUTP pyrophosphatase
MQLKVTKTHKDAKIPVYGHKGDAGLDLFSCERVELAPLSPAPVPTGIQMAVPDNHVGLIWDKSGLSLQGVHRLAGVVDSGYRGEVKVVLINLCRDTIVIEKGMKIAQMLIQPVLEMTVVETEDLDKTVRGENGFGSTGRF